MMRKISYNSLEILKLLSYFPIIFSFTFLEPPWPQSIPLLIHLENIFLSIVVSNWNFLIFPFQSFHSLSKNPVEFYLNHLNAWLAITEPSSTVRSLYLHGTGGNSGSSSASHCQCVNRRIPGCSFSVREMRKHSSPINMPTMHGHCFSWLSKQLRSSTSITSRWHVLEVV